MSPSPTRLVLFAAFLTCVAGGRAAQSTASVGVAWNDNVSNATRASDRISAFSLTAAGALETRRGLAPNLLGTVGASAQANVVPHYDALSDVSLGLSGRLERKLGLGPFASVLSADVVGTATAARDQARSGYALEGGLGWHDRFDETTTLNLTLRHRWANPRDSVYDTAGTTFAADLRRTVSDSFELFAGGYYRIGDIVAYATPPRPDLVAVARVRVSVNTFDRPMVAYSIRADTIGGRIGGAWRIGETASFSVSYEYRETTRSPLRYVNQLVTLTVLRQF